MARIGEEDPRWIVTERADGVNVDKWHWDQKDKTRLCQEGLEAAFAGAILCSNVKYRIITSGISDFLGDVTVAQRKKKTRCFFEIKFDVNWKAIDFKETGEELLSGKIHVTDCDTQTFEENYELGLTPKSSEELTDVQQEILLFIRITGLPAVREVIKLFVHKSLMAAHGISIMELKSSGPGTAPILKDNAYAFVPKKALEQRDISNTKIEKNINWYCSTKDIFEALTREDKISAYTRSKCTVHSVVGGSFDLLSGAIQGTFLKLDEPHTIVMRWRMNSWEKTQSSLVTITLSDIDQTTHMNFVHTGFPDEDRERVKHGWNSIFWNGIKVFLGFGNNLRGE